MSIKNYDDTILNQYANSQKLLDIIKTFADASSLDDFTDEFIKEVWDITSCGSWALDNWGLIVGVSRYIKPIVSDEKIFGFEEAKDQNPVEKNYPTPFNEGSFFEADTTSATVIRLNDMEFRTLVIAKAFTNLSIATIPELNRFLRILFPNRPEVHCIDTRKFGIIVKIPFIYTYEITILSNYAAVPLSSGVKLTIEIDKSQRTL